MTKDKKKDATPVAVDEYIEEAITKVRKIEKGNKLTPMNSTERYGAALALSQLIDALNALGFEGCAAVIKDLTEIQSQVLHDEAFGPVEVCYALYAALGGGTAKPRSDMSQGDEVEKTVGSPGIDFCGKQRSRKAKVPKKMVIKKEVEEGEKVKQTRKRKHQQSNVESGVKYVKHFELGNDKRISIKTVVADVVVSVRQWTLSPKGILKSGKKGLTFSVDEWLDVLAHAPAIDTAMNTDGENYEHPIEGSVFRVIVKKVKGERLVSIRDTLINAKGTFAGKRGLSLTQAEWGEVGRQRDELDATLQEALTCLEKGLAKQVRALKREQGCVESESEAEIEEPLKKKEKIEEIVVVERKEEKVVDSLEPEVRIPTLEYIPEKEVEGGVSCPGCVNNSEGVQEHMGVLGCIDSDSGEDEEI